MPEPDPAAHQGGLPISPSLAGVETGIKLPSAQSDAPDKRLFILIAWALGLGVAGGLIARALREMIALFTNLAFQGRWSLEPFNPAFNQRGAWVIIIPVIGGLIVGLMARYGSRGIRGHGIPEAMEQVLINQSRVPLRLAWLKPLSSAIAIGTGGPFGAEGPIIATGGALGSAVGQLLRTSADERKTLLACGAAAGMAATFGSPVAAVLLAIELLLFEFRASSIIPVALASVTAALMHLLMEGSGPVFQMAHVLSPSLAAMLIYLLLGAAIGACAVAVTRVVYWIEDGFAKLPIHWMWWPALGSLAVGLVGYIDPRVLGVGYAHISGLLTERWTLSALLMLCLYKFIAWSISLGSGTSGGTLAPLFIIGGSLGAVCGELLNRLMPGLGIDVHIMAIIGMAAMFAGASRAVLTSALFAFETTMEPRVLLPLLGACAVAWIVASLLMRESIMTEKISRRGIRVPTAYHADPLEQIQVGKVATRPAITLDEDEPVTVILQRLKSLDPPWSHQGFPVVDPAGALRGVVTRRDLNDAHLAAASRVGDAITRPPIAIYEDCSLREAIEHMLNHDVGRLPILTRESPSRLVGILTRSDILKAYRTRMDATLPAESQILRKLRKKLS